MDPVKCLRCNAVMPDDTPLHPLPLDSLFWVRCRECGQRFTIELLDDEEPTVERSSTGGRS